MTNAEPMTQAQVLEELELLAATEHALVVEHLAVFCALGHDLEPEEGGPTTAQGRDAASMFRSLAMAQMFRFKRVALVLVAAGRGVPRQRAASISDIAGRSIALGPPSAAQFAQLIDREEDLAAALDERYVRLRPSVTSDALFQGTLLSDIQSVVDEGQTHSAAVGSLRNAFGGLAPVDLLRAIRREPNDSFEQRLLDISDRTYRLILDALQGSFAQIDPFAGGDFRQLAVTAMETMDEVHRALVQRGMFPPFTSP